MGQVGQVDHMSMPEVVFPQKRKPPKLAVGERIAASAYGAKAHWPTGFQLYQRGTPADGVFLVLRGHVTLRTPVKGGRGFVTSIATPGETFGAEGLAANPVYVTDANAADDAETLHIGTSQFRAFVREQPANALAVLSQIMSERSALLERLHELATMNVEDRLTAVLLRLSNDPTFTQEDGMLILESGQHRLLCEMVGATRESIALALSRLVGAGIAVRHGTAFSIDPNGLTRHIRAAAIEIPAPVDVIPSADM